MFSVQRLQHIVSSSGRHRLRIDTPVTCSTNRNHSFHWIYGSQLSQIANYIQIGISCCRHRMHRKRHILSYAFSHTQITRSHTAIVTAQRGRREDLQEDLQEVGQSPSTCTLDLLVVRYLHAVHQQQRTKIHNKYSPPNPPFPFVHTVHPATLQVCSRVKTKFSADALNLICANTPNADPFRVD